MRKVGAPSDRALPRGIPVRAACGLIMVSGLLYGGSLSAGPPAVLNTRQVYNDPIGDVLLRRTDPGAAVPFDSQAHRPPDLMLIGLGRWQPANPRVNLFEGSWSGGGQFFRLDIVLKGLVNPPGPMGCCGQPLFEPYRYGPHPVYGYIELDVDADQDTGGEIDFPVHRYLGNACRFGGLPSFLPGRERAAIDGSSFDPFLHTPPWVERSGEDFHLQLVGWEIDDGAILRSDTTDMIFGPGEVWDITGRLFRRATGYVRFSSACCRSGAPLGSYEPLVTLRFAHQPGPDQTTVSLVFPLTNAGSAVMRGDPAVEPPDIFFTNQTSILEALQELRISALTATSASQQDPAFIILARWATRQPEVFLDPAGWKVTAVLATACPIPQNNSLFIWSDIWPNVISGDMDGSGSVNPADVTAFNLYIQEKDGQAGHDADGQVNGSIRVPSFGPAFSLFDLNYDGYVNAADRGLLQGLAFPRSPDLDGDGDADASDFGLMQRCFGAVEASPLSGVCPAADLTRDGVVNRADVILFLGCARGEGVPFDPSCLGP